MIEAFLFDIGNVLVTFDFSRAMKRLAARSVLDAERIREELTPLILELEVGSITTAEFVQTAMKAASFSGTPDEFAAIYNEIFEAHAAMDPLVENLGKTFPLFLLSNTSALHLDYLRARFSLFNHFRGGVFSYQARSLKPSEKIFRDVIEVCRLDPARTIYLDDAEANTATAARLGFKAFTYDWRDHARLRPFLRECGLSE